MLYYRNYKIELIVETKKDGIRQSYLYYWSINEKEIDNIFDVISKMKMKEALLTKNVDAYLVSEKFYGERVTVYNHLFYDLITQSEFINNENEIL